MAGHDGRVPGDQDRGHRQTLDLQTLMCHPVWHRHKCHHDPVCHYHHHHSCVTQQCAIITRLTKATLILNHSWPFKKSSLMHYGSSRSSRVHVSTLWWPTDNWGAAMWDVRCSRLVSAPVWPGQSSEAADSGETSSSHSDHRHWDDVYKTRLYWISSQSS